MTEPHGGQSGCSAAGGAAWRFAVGLVACAAVAVGGAACSATATTASGGVAHAARAERLRDVMREFDAAVRERVPEQTDQHDRWEGVFASIADAAAGLKVSARDVAGHPPKGLELPDRGRFQVLGRSFADAAAQLERAAARGDADAVSLARTRVAIACRDCHAHFRPDTPGVPDAFR